MSEENLLPKFHELLREAFTAEERADLFDVYSDNPESKKEWDRLRQEASEAKSRLILFVQENKQLLPQILSLTQ